MVGDGKQSAGNIGAWRPGTRRIAWAVASVVLLAATAGAGGAWVWLRGQESQPRPSEPAITVDETRQRSGSAGADRGAAAPVPQAPVIGRARAIPRAPAIGRTRRVAAPAIGDIAQPRRPERPAIAWAAGENHTQDQRISAEGEAPEPAQSGRPRPATPAIGPIAGQEGDDMAAQVAQPPAGVVKAREAGDGGGASAGDHAGTAAVPDKPAFDVVHVERSGRAVIAGRAPPGETITLRDKGRPVAEAEANAAGEFVIVPSQPLAPGKRRLTLTSDAGAAGTETRSPHDVVLAVPDTASEAQPSSAGGDRPTPIRVPRGEDGTVEVVDGEAATSQPSRLSLDRLRHTREGHLDLRGHALAGRTVTLYLGDSRLGRTEVRDSGAWRIVASPGDMAPGMHTLRLAARAKDGEVTSRIETQYAHRPVINPGKEANFVVIERGNTLWTIAERTYGEGISYHVIHEANAAQIDDPDLIYPGQVFILPANEGASDHGEPR